MRLLDLFCGIGGAADGYKKAGFDEIVGVDQEPKLQGRYPYDFILADVREVIGDGDFLRGFDLIHASPPCQSFVDGISGRRDSWLYEEWYGPGGKKADLIGVTRDALKSARVKGYVIENVDTAPLDKERSVLICGTWTRPDDAEYWTIRHRLFECSWDIVNQEPFLMMGGRLCWCRRGNAVGGQWPKIGAEGWVTVAGGTGPEYRGVGMGEHDVLTGSSDLCGVDLLESRGSYSDQRDELVEVTSGSAAESGRQREARERHDGRPSRSQTSEEELPFRDVGRLSDGEGARIARLALGMDRGYKYELNECVPPAYTAIIGESYFRFLDSVDREP